MKDRLYELSEAITYVLAKFYFFGHVMVNILTIKEGARGTIKGGLAHTDGRNVVVNPEWFETLKLPERAFILLHEVYHVIYNDVPDQIYFHETGIGPDGRRFNLEAYGHACDYRINAQLAVAGLPVLKYALFDPVKFPADMHKHEIYKILMDELEQEEQECDQPGEPGDGEPPADPLARESGQGSEEEGQQQGQGEDRGDDYGKYGKDDLPEGQEQHSGHVEELEQGDKPVSKPELQRALRQAQVSAKERGCMPGNLETYIDEMCEPQVNWSEQIAKAMMDTTRGRDTTTMKRPNRRRLAVPPNLWLPGSSGNHAGVVVIAGDTSGSVSGEEWKHYFGEAAEIVRDLRPEQTWLVSCDTVCTEPVMAQSPEDVATWVPEGGGGTDMTAIMRKLEEVGIWPESLVILTDGYTPFGEDPGYPVVWAITSDIVAPWGTTVHIEI